MNPSRSEAIKGKLEEINALLSEMDKTSKKIMDLVALKKVNKELENKRE